MWTKGRLNDKDKVAIVKELTNDMWSIQKQNVFLNSTDDILLVEGWTDEVYISKADRKSTRLNSSHITRSRMPSSA